MPSGAKKRKALKKKKQQEASTNSNKGFNGDTLHENSGHDELGSQDERGSDSNSSSPCSQGNQEFSSMVAAKEISGVAAVTQGLGPRNGDAIAVGRPMDDKKNTLDTSPNSSFESHVACQDACGNSVSEIAPDVDSVKPVVSVSKLVISEKIEHVDTSTDLNLVQHKSHVSEKYPSPGVEKNNIKRKVSISETSKIVESARESEVPESAEKKHLLLPGPPAIRTSWLSCCGLFDAMTGSER